MVLLLKSSFIYRNATGIFPYSLTHNSPCPFYCLLYTPKNYFNLHKVHTVMYFLSVRTIGSFTSPPTAQSSPQCFQIHKLEKKLEKWQESAALSEKMVTLKERAQMDSIEHLRRSIPLQTQYNKKQSGMSLIQHLLVIIYGRSQARITVS